MNRVIIITFTSCLLFLVQYSSYAADFNGLVRIAEVEVAADSIDEYMVLLNEEADASVQLEPGVIAILPMQMNENAGSVRILEVYASQQAYEAHLKTPHFLKYKQSTLPMVKSLTLTDMQVANYEIMAALFKKWPEAFTKQK